MIPFGTLCDIFDKGVNCVMGGKLVGGVMPGTIGALNATFGGGGILGMNLDNGGIDG